MQQLRNMEQQQHTFRQRCCRSVVDDRDLLEPQWVIQLDLAPEA